jgi:hypothetical protein
MYAELIRKTCSRCKKAKLHKEFQKDSRALSGLSSKCKDCIKGRRKKQKEYDKAYWQRYAGKNIEKLKVRDVEYNLKRKFGITLQDYEALLLKQNGKCATCDKIRSSNGKKLAVDHCHKTGRIRGLLCNECNTSLGLIKEDIQTLQNLIAYINDKK